MDWFETGWEWGKQYRGDVVPIPLNPVPRSPEMSDADWATFCEAVLMSADQ